MFGLAKKAPGVGRKLPYTVGKTLQSTVIGGAVSALGAAAYNQSNGEGQDVNPLTAGLIGGAAFGAARGFKHFQKAKSLTPPSGPSMWGRVKDFSGRAAGKIGENLKKFGTYMDNAAIDGAGRMTKMAGEKWGMNSPRTFRTGIALAGAAQGALGGAIIGGAHGAFSDNSTMMGGAFKGSLMGAAAFGAYRGFGGGLTKGYGKIYGIGMNRHVK